eukprot:Hpha_TRINITY_DN16605_c0_g3::TRINITY_DN16605_c0_g3_i1::g.182635::m.182635/K16600/TTLL2; tubulin polyglutamylase TTLL2
MPFVLKCDDERVPDGVLSALLNAGWQQFDEEEHKAWSLWWRVGRFRPSEVTSARWPAQRVNHIAGSWELARKDSLARHVRRMRGVFGSVYDIAPESYILPNDYVKFCKRYADARDGSAPGARSPIWICKPSAQSQGRKIFLFRKLEELTYDERSVVQRYVDRPLLIGGYKFDLRLYVLVARCQPLVAFLYKEGFARFGTLKYDSGGNCLDSHFSHLTNASINQASPFFNVDKVMIGEGCKWPLKRVAAHFGAIREGLWEALWERIRVVAALTLLSVTSNDTSFGHGVGRESFELFGFDVLIDAELKPWILEVNSSPQLALDGSVVDRSVKQALIQDTVLSLNIPAPPDDDSSSGEEPSSSPRRSHQAGAPAAALRQRNRASARGFLPGGRRGVREASGRPVEEVCEPQPCGNYERLLPLSAVTRGETPLRQVVAELRSRDEEALKVCATCRPPRPSPVSPHSVDPRPPGGATPGATVKLQRRQRAPPPRGGGGNHSAAPRRTSGAPPPVELPPPPPVAEPFRRLSGMPRSGMTPEQMEAMLLRFGITPVGAAAGRSGSAVATGSQRKAVKPKLPHAARANTAECC